MSKRLLGTTLVMLAGLAFVSRAASLTLEFDAERLFDQSVTRHLRLADDGHGIELEFGELIEDDGPAAGHSYQKPENREQLTPKTWIKKDLLISHPQARAAHLLVLSEEPIDALVNGVPQRLDENQSGRKPYKSFPFDPSLLREGRNEIVLRNSGRVMLARSDEFALGSRTRLEHPDRSAKSNDAGQTWDYEHLGPDGKLDGEYGVRIFLDHYQPEGSLQTAVLDVVNLDSKPIAPPLAEVGPIKISLLSSADPPGRTHIRARTGDTFVPQPSHWSEWESIGNQDGTIEHPHGRFLQLELELSTDDPLQSPKITGVRIEAQPKAGADWTARLSVVEQHNEQIVRTSIPFEYEPLDQPQLKQLREQYHLDDVVKGSGSELELLLRLAQWACNSWDWPTHITEFYPPWNALEILKPYADGKPTGGFCQQFNLIFLQACESFGFSGRAISISQGRWQDRMVGGGHEVVELWSNEWKKWIYVDGALAWYILDEKTGVPLSMLELRQHQLPTLRGQPVQPVRVIDAPRTRNKQFTWHGLAGPEPLNWYLELRMIPRSNFLERKSPLPLNQGTEEWAWTGHYVWTDSEVPAGLIFGNRVSKRADFEWTLNQAHYLLEPTLEPGHLRVHVDTVTPSFDTFVAEIDGAPKQKVASAFSWTLHRGKNELRIRPRNVAGVEGIPSWIVLDYAPERNP